MYFPIKQLPVNSDIIGGIYDDGSEVCIIGVPTWVENRQDYETELNKGFIFKHIYKYISHYGPNTTGKYQISVVVEDRGTTYNYETIAREVWYYNHITEISVKVDGNDVLLNKNTKEVYFDRLNIRYSSTYIPASETAKDNEKQKESSVNIEIWTYNGDTSNNFSNNDDPNIAILSINGSVMPYASVIQSQINEITGSDIIVGGVSVENIKAEEEAMKKIQEKYSLPETGLLDIQTLYNMEMDSYTKVRQAISENKTLKPTTYDYTSDGGGTNDSGDKSPIGSTSEFKHKYGNTIKQMANELEVDPNMLAAVILVESGGSGFVNGRLKIRFENHYFLNRTNGYTDLFTYYWKDHKFRKSIDEEWKPVHTNKQSSEYAAFNFAKSLNEEAAYESISMGMGQIMGAHFRAAGYNSAKKMYEDFSRGHEQQIKGMATFFKNYNNGSTLHALQIGDLETFVTQYNGNGQVEDYTNLMKKRMEEYKNAK